MSAGASAREDIGHQVAFGTPLSALLPGCDKTRQDRIAQALTEHIGKLVACCWSNLLGSCACLLPQEAAKLLDTAACAPPHTGSLLPLLYDLVTPALLLSLETAESGAVADAMLGHEELCVKERTLDTLLPGVHGSEALIAVCEDWSRRMLTAWLDRLDCLSHSQRLSLREWLVAGAEKPGPERMRAGDLREALRLAADGQASRILAERAGIVPAIVDAAALRHDAKLLVSLCWSAGCDASETIAVQIQLGRVRPDAVLHVAGACWPLPTAAMQWRIDAAFEQAPSARSRPA